MRSTPNLVYRLLHKDYPESFATYSPWPGDFYDLVRPKLPEEWSIHRHVLWFYCSPPHYVLPAQGWKIHVSATPANSREVLETVVSIVVKRRDTSLKFVVDRALLSLLNCKSWPRAASGKFITVYPPDNRVFCELIEDLHLATRDMRGPYILSDHRYKASRVVFYRYGGMRMHSALNIRGEKVPVLMTPDGGVVPDRRLPYPVIPDWENDPVLSAEVVDTAPTSKFTLRDGRYTVETALSFSSAGGVYSARDNQTGKKVVVKEARPCINATEDGYDAVELLKKEHRLLSVVAGTGIAPQPIELFQEWEHWFLTEEFVEGTPMGRHSAANNILLRTRATARECQEWCAMFTGLCAALMDIVRLLHDRGIVFGDISTNNLIVTSARNELKIIDFEGAHQAGVDRPANIYTPGFVSKRRIAGSLATQEDDYYSVGAVLLAYLLPLNGFLHLNPCARHAILASVRDDVNLPQHVPDLINSLMDHGGEACLDPPAAVRLSMPASLSIIDRKKKKTIAEYRAVVNDILAHVNDVASYEREDRLYPADPRVFSTNPLSVAYGAAGIAYALHKITGNVPGPVVDWILRHRVTCEDYPPGLYVGISGIAWSLLEMDLKDPAEKLFQSTFTHPLLHESADLFYGTAGWAMTALRFFHATGNEVYLKQAREAGNGLLASCVKSERGHHWSKPGECPLGLAHGNSGVALFLLYLYLTTEDDRFFDAGVQALDFDLSAAITTKDGGLSWKAELGTSSTVYPYWRFGSAGIGSVAVRFQHLLGSPRYSSILEQIFVDTDRKCAVFPGRFMGLAGIGSFLLDLHDFTGEARFLESAAKVADGIMNFRVERNGAAFPGEMQSRLCCDYATGSAGIALFFDHLAGGRQIDFMLDEAFPARLQANNAILPPQPLGTRAAVA